MSTTTNGPVSAASGENGTAMEIEPNGGIWYLDVSGGTAKVQYSIDGENWTDATSGLVSVDTSAWIPTGWRYIRPVGGTGSCTLKFSGPL